MATINGKSVLLNESVVFAAGETVELGGAFPLRITGDPNAPLNLGMAWVAPTFVFTLDGLSATMLAQVIIGTGNHNGRPIKYRAHALNAGKVGLEELFDLTLTVFEA